MSVPTELRVDKIPSKNPVIGMKDYFSIVISLILLPTLIISSSSSYKYATFLERVIGRAVNNGTKDPMQVNNYDENIGHAPQLPGNHLTNGDIMMTNEEEREYFGDSTNQDDDQDEDLNDSIVGENRRWKIPIPYEFGPSAGYFTKSSVEKAFKDLAKSTCIRFRPKKGTDRDYMSFEKKSGCFSHVGKKRYGGKQTVSIGYGCEFKSIALHEILHALGIFHEQSRPDRDQYVEIQWDNIMKGKKHNFQKEKKAETFGIPYDYRSLMHYGKYDFSKLPPFKSVMKPLKGGFFQLLGQFSGIHGHMTKLDIQLVNRMYNCPAKESSTRRRRWFGKK